MFLKKIPLKLLKFLGFFQVVLLLRSGNHFLHDLSLYLLFAAVVFNGTHCYSAWLNQSQVYLYTFFADLLGTQN